MIKLKCRNTYHIARLSQFDAEDDVK